VEEECWPAKEQTTKISKPENPGNYITDYKERYFCVAVAIKILKNSTSFINAQTDKKHF